MLVAAFVYASVGHGGASVTAEKFGVPFLGEIPLDIAVREGGDRGHPVVIDRPDSPAGRAFAEIACSVAAQVSIANANDPGGIVIQ